MHRKRFLMAAAVLTAAVLTAGGPAWANEAFDARQLVARAQLTYASFAEAQEMSSFRELVKKARGVFIAPAVLRGAFVVGASGGNGIFVARDKEAWTGPAFYTIGQASFGLQAGGDVSEMILLAMTERGVTSLLQNSVKLGAAAGIAAGPVGIGVTAATANLSADMLSFSRAKGLYGGVSLEGAVVTVRHGLNRAYYGKKVSPTDIFIRKTVDNSKASALFETLSR